MYPFPCATASGSRRHDDDDDGSGDHRRGHFRVGKRVAFGLNRGQELKLDPIFASNSREKALAPARDFGQELLFFHSEWTSSMVIFGIVVVVVVVVAVVTGRRAGRSVHLYTLWPTIPQ